MFGIAISFGSQTLVKDIVSGLFYLSDDAFRVGEQTDCGKARGTVQRETLKRMFDTFPAMDFEFAKEGANIVLHTAPASLGHKPKRQRPRHLSHLSFRSSGGQLT